MTSDQWKERFGDSLKETFEYGYCVPPYHETDLNFGEELYILTRADINRMLRDTLLSVEAVARDFLMFRKEPESNLPQAAYASLIAMANKKDPFVSIMREKEEK